MTERQVNMNYLKGKYISPTWGNMLEECQDWYKEGLKQGKFDKDAEKQQLISFIRDKIQENIDKNKRTNFDLDPVYTGKISSLQELLDFVNKGGKE